jgi:hypothetical protein
MPQCKSPHSEASLEAIFLTKKKEKSVVVSPGRLMLDVMHCKKNLCENIIIMLMCKKDSPSSRQDMEDLQICSKLWLKEGGEVILNSCQTHRTC